MLLLAAALTSGCGTTKPPLPKFATGEAPPRPSPDDAWIARLRQADVIYFCLTKRATADNQQAWRVLEHFRQSGEQVAFGWSMLSVAQQPLFDRWRRQEITRTQLLERLPAAMREDWAPSALRADLPQVALGGSGELLRKIRDGEALTAEEIALLPRDYRSRPESFDNFVDRVSGSNGLRRYNFAQLYRAHLAAEQMIAENVLRFTREHAGTKLIVFLPNDLLIESQEIADYVAQKASLRQMILDRRGLPNEPHPQLLASWCGGRLQVVDRAPRTARHHRCLVAPRLTT
ncbi:MAG TPA: ChaN family lipoprotein [Chthoniobacterales bacterium]|jgi:hypothetical protein